MPEPEPEALLDKAARGERAALAKLLSLVERGGDAARQVSTDIIQVSMPDERSYTVGLTGAPGTGKSTLTSALLRVVRQTGDRVAVLAIDPSSPYSGGAILGDRIRMGDHALDEGIFVRSMATRGHLGGLAVAAPEAVRVLGAAGYPWVLVETVGVGQVEVEVAGHSDTTVVVVSPGWGDAVQAAKAGLMEIADVFVVNKADRPGADETGRDLERMLRLRSSSGKWVPPVVMTTATTGDGSEDAWHAIREHRQHLEQSGELGRRRRRRATDEIANIVTAMLAERARKVTEGPEATALAEAVASGRVDPWSAASELLSDHPEQR